MIYQNTSLSEGKLIKRTKDRQIYLRHLGAGGQTDTTAQSRRLPDVRDLQAALHMLLDQAVAVGAPAVEVRAGDLHTLVGGYPSKSHRMPTCCDVMYASMRQGDRVIKKPPKGKGANLIIRYLLPRE